MLTELAPLGAKHKLNLVPEFDGAGNVTVVVMVTPKGKDDDDDDKGKGTRTFSVTGTIAEVEAELPGKLAEAATLFASHADSLDQLKAQLDADVKETKEKADKEKAKPTPAAAKPAKGKGTPAKAKPAPASKPEAKAEPEAQAAATPVIPVSELKPAWKKKQEAQAAAAAAPAAPTATEVTPDIATKAEPDLSSLFGDEPSDPPST